MKYKRMNFFGVFRRAFIEFQKQYDIIISYELIYKFIATIILIPLISKTTKFFISKGGYDILTNFDLFKFILTIQGILATLILIIIISSSILIELGGTIIISGKGYNGEKVNLKTAFINSIKNLPKFFTLGGIQILLYILLITPFSQVGLLSSLVENISIPQFIMDYIIETPSLLILMILVAITAYLYSIRWVFVLNIAVLEGKSFKEALNKSKTMVKGSYVYIFKNIILFHAITYGVLIGIVFLGYSLLGVIVYQLGIQSLISISIISVFSTIQRGFIYLLTLIISPLNIIFITVLYYEQIKYKNEKVYITPKIVHYENSKFENKFLTSYKKSIPIFIVSGIIFFAVTLGIYIKFAVFGETITEITAHRGYSVKAPENTLSALKYAIDEGVNYSEIDVQETKDGEIVLFHDKNLKRITGENINIWDIDYENIRKLDAGKWFDEKFEGERIPSLREAIRLSRGKMKLNIEIKTNGHDKELVESVLKIIEEENFENDCVITSTDYKALQKVRNLNPNIRIGYIIYVAIGDLFSLDVDFYSIEASLVNEKLLKEAQLREKEIHVWTVNEQEDMEKFIKMGVDNIITDYPRELKEEINERKGMNRIDRILEELLQQLSESFRMEKALN